MKMIELSTSQLKSFNLTLCDGQAVVRNQNRVNGLIGVRESMIPEQYHGLLAKAEFTGNVVNESIVWSTGVFSSKPVRLSELKGDEAVRYDKILNEALVAYAKSVSDAEDGVKKLLYAAITYPSRSSVFCADDRVVITEWGMNPVGSGSLAGMPYSIDDEPEKPKKEDGKPAADKPAGGENDRNNHDDAGTDEKKATNDSRNTDDAGKDGKKATDDSRNTDDANNGVKPVSPKIETKENDDNAGKESPMGNASGGAAVSNNGGGGSSQGKGCRWKLLWLLPLLLLLLIALLFLLFGKGCSSPMDEVRQETPAMDSTDVVLSSDSLRYVAGNRLLLLLTGDNVKMEDFVGDFRKVYPDGEKYILSNPDTVIRRFTLTLPAEERVAMEEKLPVQFADYGLVVIPESMYRNSYVPNDPAMQDVEKRWYFDECAVFDAWDVTMGDDDIVVAVIDDGFDLSHPELQGKIVSPYNAVTHTSNVTPSASGHGTHVAATAVGNAGNGEGTSGIAPNCKLMPIQVADAQGNMATSAILDGVIYAINNGADVVNMSLGIYFGPFVQFVPVYIQKNFRANMFLEEERVWNHLFNIARQRGMIFVIAGGNENILIGLDPMARSENTIRVSAVQPDRAKASFSNYGDYSTVSAPGVQIYNAIPNDNYAFFEGTSMASPIVAGGCALLKSKDPDMSVTEAAGILRMTGIPSTSDVGPIVNFARALEADYGDVDECARVNERYNELLAELEELRRQYPGCIQQPDTLSIPEDMTVEQLDGRWKSTTSLYNEQDEEVVIYFTFNGTPVARLDIVEPSGEIYTAVLAVSVSGDQIFIDQQKPAYCQSNGKGYNPYRFVLRPDRNRKAVGSAKNKVEIANAFNFNLIKI